MLAITKFTLFFQLGYSEKVLSIPSSVFAMPISLIYLQSDFKGEEHPATLQDALQLISIENPARNFARLYKNGVLQENYSEADCEPIAEISNLLADLWQYTVKQDADGKDMRPYMNPLHLLCNSFMLIKTQQEIIKQYYEEFGPLSEQP